MNCKIRLILSSTGTLKVRFLNNCVQYYLSLVSLASLCCFSLTLGITMFHGYSPLLPALQTSLGILMKENICKMRTSRKITADSEVQLGTEYRVKGNASPPLPPPPKSPGFTHATSSLQIIRSLRISSGTNSIIHCQTPDHFRA